MAKRTAGDVLLELLDKVPDAGALEILLEPEHLLTLLRKRGFSDDAIRAQLRAGEKLPGELLLEVLAREPNVSVLLAELGNPAPKPRRVSTAVVPGKKGSPFVRILVGALLAFPSAWYLFVRLDFLNAPGLARFFPGAYALVISVLLVGIAMMLAGLKAAVTKP